MNTNSDGEDSVITFTPSFILSQKSNISHVNLSVLTVTVLRQIDDELMKIQRKYVSNTNHNNRNINKKTFSKYNNNHHHKSSWRNSNSATIQNSSSQNRKNYFKVVKMKCNHLIFV